MTRKEEAERLLRSGLYPSQIASQMDISVSSVIQYLRTRVGEGALRLSDIYLAFPADKRAVLEEALEGSHERGYVDSRSLQHHGLTTDEAELFRGLRLRRVLTGDMY